MSSDPNKIVKLLFTCLDWRLHPQIENFFTKDGIGGDLCVNAGSVKDLIDPKTQDFFIKQIEISKKLHNCQAVILTMHLDCGAYGGTAAFANRDAEIETAKNELKKAQDIVKQNFPDLPAEMFIVGLEKSENGWAIQPQKIDL